MPKIFTPALEPVASDSHATYGPIIVKQDSQLCDFQLARSEVSSRSRVGCHRDASTVAALCSVPCVSRRADPVPPLLEACRERHVTWYTLYEAQ